MALIGTAGSAIAAVQHCGITFIHRLRQEEQQLHLHCAVPGQISPISSPSDVGQVLLKSYLAQSSVLCLARRGSWEKNMHFYQRMVGNNLLRMKMDPSFPDVLSR